MVTNGGESSWQSDDIPTDEQEFYYDGSDMTKDDLGGPPMVNKPGWYHFEIGEVTLDLKTVNDKGEEKSPSAQMSCIVQHSTDGLCPAGTRLYHKVFLAGPGGKPAADGSKKSAFAFGCGIRLFEEITPPGEEKPRLVIAGTTNSKISSKDWLKAKGRHFIAEVKHSPASGQYREKWELDYGRVYWPDDPYVDDVPKNVDILAAIGIKAKPGIVKAPPQGGGKQAPATAKKPPVTPPPATQETKPPPAAPAIDLSDI